MIRTTERELKDYLDAAEESIQQVLILPHQSSCGKADSTSKDLEQDPIAEEDILLQSAHPIWTDSTEILQIANQQILQPLGAFPTEQIIAYIGVHAQTIVSGKRSSIGFLITNFRILTQTHFSVIGNAKKAQVKLFTQKQDPKELINEVWDGFFINNTLSIPQERLLAMKRALEDVLLILMPSLQRSNHLPEEFKKSSTLLERIIELGLQDVLKTFDRDQKMQKKFADKHQLKDVIVGVVDKPLFGGVYGLVITRSGIASRDVMEDCFTSTWDEIRQYPATLGDKSDVIFAGRKNHIIPTYQKDYAPSIIVLINEVANNEVVI